MVDGFEKPDYSVPRRLIASVAGLEGSGKTHFALTSSALGLTAYIDTDINAEGVLHKFKANDIVRMEIESGSSLELEKLGVDAYKAEWEKFRTGFYAALNNPHVKNIIGDNWTEIWELCRLAEFSRLAQVPSHFYGKVNAEMRKIIRDAKARPDINLILIHKLQNEYVNDKTTGKKVLAGFKDIPFLVQMGIMCEHTPGGDFKALITKCTHEPAYEGLELTGADCSFPALLDLVHGSK
jgi:hypothetical protein